MYLESGIGKLSPTQLSKLLNGHSVRLKHGSAHKVYISVQQHKKLQKAHAKGKAATMMFDPFQIQSHQYLRGKGAMVMKPPHTIMYGGTTAKDWLANQYNQIPEAYHPGLESLGRAGLSQAGFGLKKRGRPRKIKGGDIFEDMLDGLTNAGRQMLSVAPKTPVSDYLINEYTVDKTGEAEKSRKRAEQYRKDKAMKGKGNIMEDFGDASQKFLQGAMRDTPDWMKGPDKDPLAFLYGGKLQKKKTGGSLLSSAAKHVLKPMAKKVAKQVIKYGVNAAGPAAAAAAMAMGQPDLAPLAAKAGNFIAREKAATANKYIDGLGLKKRRGRPKKMNGKALAPVGYHY
jgi:hypothetical protein